jgi:glycine hydroxymethyltransferase
VRANTLQQRGYKIVSGGTDNHMFLVDLIAKDISGKDAEHALGEANMTVNKNMVPNDPRSPFVTSGLRIGTPAITTRGFKEAETEQVANWISDILDDISNLQKAATIKQAILTLCRKFPVYQV